MDIRGDSQAEVPAWTPPLELDGAPLIANASIRDFQQGMARHVANAVEQALLLLGDMVDLRLMRKYEVFLSLKRAFALVRLFSSFFILKIITALFVCFYFYLTVVLHSLKGCLSCP